MRATPRRPCTGWRGGPVPARRPCGGPRWGRRLGSRRAGSHLAGRPARRCVIPAPARAGMVSPPARAAMRPPRPGRGARPARSAGRRRPPGRLGDPPGARGTRRGGAPLVDKLDGDPSGLRLVAQGAYQVPDPPGADTLVVPPPGVQAEDAARVADGQRTDLPATAQPIRSWRRLGLPHPPLVPGLGGPLASLVLAPPPRAALSGFGARRATARRRLWRRGGADGTPRGSPAPTPAATPAGPAAAYGG